MSLTKRRSTGPSPAVRALVWERDGGCCVRCGSYGAVHTYPPHALHHRSGRRAGGSRLESKNSPANLVLLCSEDHTWAESERTDAEAEGMIVREYDDPATTPLVYRGQKVLLTHDGQIKECP